MHRFTANLAARLEEALGSARSYQPWFANFNASFSTNSPLTAPSFLLNKCWIFTQPPNNTKFSLNPLTTRSFHFNPAYKPYFHSSLTNPSSHSTLLNQQMPGFCLTPQICKFFSQPPIEILRKQCFFQNSDQNFEFRLTKDLDMCWAPHIGFSLLTNFHFFRLDSFNLRDSIFFVRITHPKMRNNKVQRLSRVMSWCSPLAIPTPTEEDTELGRNTLSL